MEEELEIDPVDGEKPPAPDQEVDEGTGRVAAFRMAFKDRLKTYGVRYQPGASESGANFNRVQTAEKVADHNDSQRITWIANAPPGKDAYFGHEVCSLCLLSNMHANSCCRYSSFPIRSCKSFKCAGPLGALGSTARIVQSFPPY
jgi:hypothetical protein